MSTRRAGSTSTVSISVDAETRSILKAEARRRYGGNVSALITAIAKEAKRQNALEWLLAVSGSPRFTDTERDALLAEIDGKERVKRRVRRAS